mmetsp:Transcript_29912/g.50670  ORF Transcript_29912/g.50670 Transcript_29912/m.50670 type:complete len:124 (-) Transcript_29912:4-375(-)
MPMMVALMMPLMAFTVVAVVAMVRSNRLELVTGNNGPSLNDSIAFDHLEKSWSKEIFKIVHGKVVSEPDRQSISVFLKECFDLRILLAVVLLPLGKKESQGNGEAEERWGAIHGSYLDFRGRG